MSSASHSEFTRTTCLYIQQPKKENKMAPTMYDSGRGGVLQGSNSYLIPLSSLIQPVGPNSPTSVTADQMDIQAETAQRQEKSRAKRTKTKIQTGRGVVQRNDSYLVPLSTVSQQPSKVKLPEEKGEEGEESYLVLSLTKGKPTARRQAVKRKGQQPVKNAAATTKRLLGTGAVQQYESRSTPLKPKGRQTLSRNKKPINTNARKPKKQQTSSSSGSDSETTLEKIGNRPNPKYEYVMK